MRTDNYVIGDVATGGSHPFEGRPIPKTGSRLVETSQIHRDVQELVPVAAELRRQELLGEWDTEKYRQAAKDAPELLGDLAEYGMAWRDVAKVVGVSVPAIQKWRRGAGMTGDNRLRLAGVVALLECLEHRMAINSPVSWLEMPVVDDVAVTAMDMLASGRFDLVLELAADNSSLVHDRVRVLEEFDPEWRETRVDDTFEVFEASDGLMSIRVRESSSS